MCVCVCVHAHKECSIVFILFLRFYDNSFVDLVKCSLLALVTGPHAMAMAAVLTVSHNTW